MNDVAQNDDITHLISDPAILSLQMSSCGAALNHKPADVVNDSSDPKQNVPQTLHIRKHLDMI